METADEAPIVELRDVTKVYRQGDIEVYALRELSLAVRKGEFTALCGPSGSGKTTVLNLVGALDEPTSGTIHLEGHDLGGLGRRALSRLRRDRIGFVFQAYNLIPVLTARENVEFVMQVQGEPAANRRDKAEAILTEVGLEGLGDRRPAQMSGGQQQRVAVARAIVSRPEMVLADEPTANLDSKTSDQLMELFVDLNKLHNTTFIIATHDQRVMGYARRLIRMLDGRIVDDIQQNAA